MIRKGKYILNWKYAIGEIVLIFIGISLAIAFQNWNDQRKEKEVIEGYLKTIQKNIQTDTVDIKLQNQLYKSKSKMAMAYIRNLFLEQYSADTLVMALPAIAERYVRVDLSGFESLKNSGFIGKLQGTKVSEALFDYYNYYYRVLDNEKSLNNYVETMEAKLFDMLSEILIESFKYVSEEIFGNVIVQPKYPQRTVKELYHNSHLFGIMQRTADENTDQYELLFKKAEILLELIEDEIN